MKRTATAAWMGDLKAGKGTMTTKSKVLDEQNYSFHSRFEDGAGTNPEELIAAAHAGCFSMALSNMLAEAGFTPAKVETKCTIDFKDLAIVESHLDVKAEVPGISADEFDKHVKAAKEGCPISKVLNTEITMEYTLN